jgi:hypothetical protein
MKEEARYRMEIVEQQDGWWVGEIWNANDQMERSCATTSDHGAWQIF